MKMFKMKIVCVMLHNLCTATNNPRWRFSVEKLDITGKVVN